jgi:hypothetical protein
MQNDTMDFIEAWVREHINATTYRPSWNGSRAEELAKWLRQDATAAGVSDEDIDTSVAGLIGAGHGLVNSITEAMNRIVNLDVPISGAGQRLADKDI